MNDRPVDPQYRSRIEAVTSYLVSKLGDTSIVLSSESAHEHDRFSKTLGLVGLDGTAPNAEVRLRLDTLAELLVMGGYREGGQAPKNEAFAEAEKILGLNFDDLQKVQKQVNAVLSEWSGPV